ncbi:hypothetical protein ACFLQ2_00330 [archaeon]
MVKELDKAWRPDTRKRFERGSPFTPKTPFEAAVNFMKEERAHSTGDIYAAVSKHFKITPDELNAALANQAAMPKPFVKRAVWDGYYHLTPDGMQLRKLIISHVPIEPMETRPVTKFEALKDEYKAITENHLEADATRFANCFMHGPGKTADIEVGAGGGYSTELLKRDSEIKKWIDEHKQKHPELMDLVRGVKSFTFPDLMRDVSAHKELLRLVGMPKKPKVEGGKGLAAYVEKLFRGDNMKDLRQQKLGRHAGQRVSDPRLPGILTKIGADYIREHPDDTATVSKRVGDGFRSNSIRRTNAIMDAIAAELKEEGITMDVTRSEPMVLKLNEEGGGLQDGSPSEGDKDDKDDKDDEQVSTRRPGRPHRWASPEEDPGSLLLGDTPTVNSGPLNKLLDITEKVAARQELSLKEKEFVKNNYHGVMESTDPKTLPKKDVKGFGSMRFLLRGIAGKKEAVEEVEDGKRPVTDVECYEALRLFKIMDHPRINSNNQEKIRAFDKIEGLFGDFVKLKIKIRPLTHDNFIERLHEASMKHAELGRSRDESQMTDEEKKKHKDAKEESAMWFQLRHLANYLVNPRSAKYQLQEEVAGKKPDFV